MDTVTGRVDLSGFDGRDKQCQLRLIAPGRWFTTVRLIPITQPGTFAFGGVATVSETNYIRTRQIAEVSTELAAMRIAWKLFPAS